MTIDFIPIFIIYVFPPSVSTHIEIRFFEPIAFRIISGLYICAYVKIFTYRYHRERNYPRHQ